MPRKLLDRLASFLAPVAISVTLVAAGCEAPPPAQSEVELRASGPSDWALAHGDDIAAELVEDPAFDLLLQTGVGIASDLHAAHLQLSDEELEAITYTTTRPWFPEVMSPGTLLGHLGGEPNHLNQMRTLLEHLQAEHGLLEAPPEDVRHVFGLALASDEVQDKLLTAASAVFVSDLEFDPCEQACINAYVVVAIVAIDLYLLAMAVAVATFPFGVVLAALATATLNETLARAQAERDTCIAHCNGTVDDLHFCGDWDVCEEDEYCSTGFLGLGPDECRPKKEQGMVCSGHDKCLSGCCKYHPASHPLSMTCRPASKCD